MSDVDCFDCAKRDLEERDRQRMLDREAIVILRDVDDWWKGQTGIDQLVARGPFSIGDAIETVQRLASVGRVS